MSTRRGPKPADLLGKQFGYLKVLSLTDEKDRRGLVWLVQCQCGKELKMVSVEITKKKKREAQAPRSCGCYYKTHRSSRYKGVGDLSKSKWLVMNGHAKRKGLEFKISIEEAWELFLKQDKTCALSGVPIVLCPSSMAAGASTASLDRIDSSKGYIQGNVQWVHVVINDLKSNLKQEEFVDWCRRVAGIAHGAEFGKPPATKPKFNY